MFPTRFLFPERAPAMQPSYFDCKRLADYRSNRHHWAVQIPHIHHISGSRKQNELEKLLHNHYNNRLIVTYSSSRSYSTRNDENCDKHTNNQGLT